MTLLEYLPGHYQQSPEVRCIQGALQPEIEALWKKKDGLFDQLDLRKATWGLDYWERSRGIPVDHTKSYELRRARIYAKLRGTGPVTVAMVRRVVSSYTALDIEIDQHPAEFTFDIKFLGTSYSPENLDGLREALDEIIPSELDYNYILIAEAGQLTLHTGFVTRIGRRTIYTVDGRTQNG